MFNPGPYFIPIFLAGLFVLPNSTYAQAIPDSLNEKLKHAGNDSIRIRTLLDIGEATEATSIASSMNYYRQALTEAGNVKNKHLQLSALNDIGIAFIENNKFDSAIIYLEKAVLIANAIHDDEREARITINIGNVYILRHDRLKAIEYYLKSAHVLEQGKGKQVLPSLYANICSLFSDQGEYAKSVEYGNKAVSLAEELGDDHAQVQALINLSETYGNLKDYEKQLELLNKALPLALKGKDIEHIASIYHDLGAYYYEKKDYRTSLNQYLQAFSYSKRLDNLYHLCTAHSVLAVVYNKLGENKKAMEHILLAEKLAEKVGARADMKEIYQTRGEIEYAVGHYKLAADYLSKRIELSDSLFNAATSEKVAEVEAKYQNEKKQEEILQLQKDKKIQTLTITQKSTLNYILIGSVAGLLILGFLGYRNTMHRHMLSRQQDELQRQRIRELEKDKQLVAVDSLLKGEENERSRLAKDLHDGLGGLLSGVKFSLSNMKDNLIITSDNMAILERSLDMIDSSIRELRRVAHNMMPEMLAKFGLDETLKEYCSTINATKLLTVKYQSLGLENRLDQSTEIIIYRIVQELLNNVLKHAVASEAFVQLIKEGSRLNIVVEDNGRGFDILQAEKSHGAGIANVRSRVDYLKGELEIHAEPGKGTLVNIEIKLSS